MRASYSEIVELARLRDGQMASTRGDRNGAFRFYRSGHSLLVIASDGSDWASTGLAGEPWEHVSVSNPTRCPSWGEMTWLKGLFFEESEAVLQFHPARSSYVNIHPFCLHLWRPTKSAVAMPPLECV